MQPLPTGELPSNTDARPPEYSMGRTTAAEELPTRELERAKKYLHGTWWTPCC